MLEQRFIKGVKRMTTQTKEKITEQNTPNDLTQKLEQIAVFSVNIESLSFCMSELLCKIESDNSMDRREIVKQSILFLNTKARDLNWMIERLAKQITKELYDTLETIC